MLRSVDFSYRPPPFFNAGHLQTMYPTLFRPTPVTTPVRERLEIPDGDFLDIDWHFADEGKFAEKVVVVSHGLEGNSRKKYPLGMARHLKKQGWDVVCLNFRGCSGEPNRLLRFYHSGVTDDLHTVLTHVLEKGGYGSAGLVGFSMGGNQTLKYLGENPDLVPPEVKGAATFSVPCDLASSADVLARTVNRLYMHYFMRGLRSKIRDKAEQHPGEIDLGGLDEMRSFIPFDDKYTAPIHGFADAAEYYAQSSSLQFLPAIRVPTLLVQAQDDPFLAPSCYPLEAAEGNSSLMLQMPVHGGHVGFVSFTGDNCYWSEASAAKFFSDVL